MSNQQDKILEKMNEIRIIYIKSNNRIADFLDSLSTTFFQNNSKLQPCICKNLREIIENKLRIMREISVDNISYGLDRYIDIISESNNFFNEISKTRRFSKKIIEILEKSFKIEQYPSDYEKTRLAKLCNLTQKQINNWFTNKRNRTKSYKTSHRY